MKRVWWMVIAVFAFSLAGCAAIQSDVRYSGLAKEQDFNYFFPSHSFTRTFADTEEAYDYVRTAQAKFSTSSGKSRAGGLAGKLSGPPVSGEQPVTVYCFMSAEDDKEVIDLDKIDKPLEVVMRNAIFAGVVFLAFYEDRQVSVSSFYLPSNYRFRGNPQYSSYKFNDNTYSAEYPPNWSAAGAFSYLRKEID